MIYVSDSIASMGVLWRSICTIAPFDVLLGLGVAITLTVVLVRFLMSRLG